MLFRHSKNELTLFLEQLKQLNNYCQMQGLTHAASQFQSILKVLGSKHPIDYESREVLSEAVKVLTQQKTVILASFAGLGRDEQAAFESMQKFYASGSVRLSQQMRERASPPMGKRAGLSK